MLAVEEKINSGDLGNLVRLQGEELRRKNAEIEALKELLEAQAEQLVRRQTALDACRRQLGMSAAV